MLNLNNIELWRAHRELLHDVTVSIHSGEKVGITGANGVGKSSLFALIRGELQADAGEMDIPARAVIAHVAQETPALQQAAIEYVLDGDVPLREIEANLLAAQAQQDGVLEAKWHAELDAIDGYRARSRAAVLLNGLGFSEAQQSQPVASFSGGWRMRLNLATALMCRSDILLLDEPTNHLDLDAVFWLEDWLKSYPGTLLLISHDRDFLDNVCNKIIHMENQELRLFSGNYSSFEKQYAGQQIQQQAAFEKQQRERAHMESFVERFRAKASKAKQAQSRLKALNRMDEISQVQQHNAFQFEFLPCKKLSGVLLKLVGVSAGYESQGQQIEVLHNIGLAIETGERIGILGRNGAGKSTLIKVLAGTLLPMSGNCEIKDKLKISYFAQHQLEQLDSQATPLLHFQRLDNKANDQSLRDFLGRFGFQGEKALEAISTFSGGQKARLVLATQVYQQPDLLLLDEPTNHLDLEMRAALCMALQNYDGAVCIVSHDRFLLNAVADRLLLVHDRQATEYSGDLDDYKNWLLDKKRDLNGAKSIPANNTNKKNMRQQAA
ncbi:MAG: ATP-binding cassette domain-containing protein, partial [Gammaproteobacteria bacterium]|nr:ATP-binding cassette domain-containing protein [Gammaproteobacteria bacterium]